MSETTVSPHVQPRRKGLVIAVGLLPAVITTTLIAGSTAVALPNQQPVPTPVPAVAASALVEAQEVQPVTAPPAEPSAAPVSFAPEIEIILPPPPPPPPPTPSRGTHRSRSASSAASQDPSPQELFCYGGGGASAHTTTLHGLVDAANVERARFGYGPLRWSDSLASASQAWASQLAANDDATAAHHDAMAHNPNRPRGGENVAMSFNYAGISAEGAIQRAHDGWMISPGHCKNLLNPKWTVVGAGHAVTSDGTTRYTVANYA